MAAIIESFTSAGCDVMKRSRFTFGNSATARSSAPESRPLFGEIDGDRSSAVEHCIEMSDVAGSHDEVDPWRAFQNRFAFLLRDAAADADRQVTLALHLAEAAEAGEDFVLRLFADRAGVQQDEIGGRLIFDALVAAQFEIAGQALAVEIVHLTAPGFDEKSFGHGFRSALASVARFVCELRERFTRVGQLSTSRRAL